MSVYAGIYGATYGIAAAVPDSLIIADSIELLGGDGGTASANPQCAGAIFRLQPGYDLSAPQPATDIVASLIMDGERPYGRRAANRTITLPLQIVAPDFTTLAAAYEVLLQAVDAPTWTLTWTRSPSGPLSGGAGQPLPLILDCFRAQPSIVSWGGADQSLINPIGVVQLTFQAYPYGRSDAPVQVAVASPVPGQSVPPAPVVLDLFSSVTGAQWTSTTQHVTGPHSAMWDPSIAPLSTPGGAAGVAAFYTRTGIGPFNLTGLTVLSVWAGFNTNYWTTWHSGPVTFAFTITDGTHTLSFSATRKITAVAQGVTSPPGWTLVSAPIPLGSATFNYAAVTGYTVQVSNRAGSGAPPALVIGPSLRYARVYLDAVTANPQSLQVPSARGAVYRIPGVAGTARTPVSLQLTQPGGAQSVTFPNQGTFPWVAQASVAAVTGTGGGGYSGPLAAAGQSGGGGGGEEAGEPAMAFTVGNVYQVTVGAGDVPPAGPVTLAITTTSLPSGSQNNPYTVTLGATGGTLPYTWSVSVGALPAGLALNSSTGIISGIPTVAATTSFTVQVADAAAATATLATSIRVTAASVLTITTTSLPAVTAGNFYNQRLAATGGVAPLAWSVPATSIGAFVDTTTYASQLAAISAYISLTGVPLTARRIYYAQSTFPATPDKDLLADQAAGRTILATLRPSWTGTLPTTQSIADLAAISKFLSACVTAGLKMQIALWHEPFFAGMTALQYKNMITYYGPAVRSFYPLWFVTANSSVNHNSENTYYPGDAACDGVATDYYDYGLVTNGDTLALAATIADAAVPPKPFGLWEFDSCTTAGVAQTQAQATTFFSSIQSFFAARTAAGKANGYLMFFSSNGASGPPGRTTQLTSAADYRIPLIQSLYQGSSPPPSVTLDPATGILAGTALLPGTYPFTVTVTDSLLATDTQALTLKVNPQAAAGAIFYGFNNATGIVPH